MFDANGDSEEWCETCSRYKEAGDTEFLNLGDGRQLCLDCSSIAVKSREECDIIIQNVFEFFRSLNLQVNENIPILFINKNQMRKILKGSGVEDIANGLFHPSVSTAIQCLSTYRASLPFKIRYVLMYILRKLTTICTIQMREEYSRCGLKSLNFGKYVKFLLGDTILVLSGIPDVEMGGILAHETMHGWLRSHGKAWEWEISVEEGICQVMYYKWLQWFSNSSKGFTSLHKTNEQVQHTRRLKECLARDIEWSDDEVYGQGFRNAMHAIETFKFKPTLDHIVKDGTLPVVPPLPPVVMRKRTESKTTDELLRKKTTTFPPIAELLWKATSNTLKATAAFWKVITATSETLRFVAMEGRRHDQYHQGGPGQGHKYLLAPMKASLTRLLIFIGIVVEHD